MQLLLVEDDAGYRDALSTVLMLDDNTKVIACPDGEAALFEMGQPPRDFQAAIVDIDLPGISGVETILRLRKLKNDLPILVLTVFEKPGIILDAIRAGASGYLLKGTPLKEICEAVKNVSKGLSPLSERVAHHIIAHLHQPIVDNNAQTEILTEREAEVLELFGRGESYKRVAYKLGINIGTVQTYAKRIYRKLKVSSKSEAIWVQRKGM